ncbi:MAG: RHS repeat protein [Nitrospira sp.]|nr:RHS repeat protein [Nitrospira sp.]
MISCSWSKLVHGLAGLTLISALILEPCAQSPAGDISYIYDNLGRLMAVIDPATDTAIYSYDAVGNLLGITRQNSATLAIFQFTPDKGPVGTTVTIYGTGFSATPASNTVKFNGTTTSVLTATTTVLTANVPAGATNGSISVTVAGVTATSASNFTVGVGGAPTLSSFSPAVGNYGATVTLTGTNYDTTLINNRVAFTAAMGAVSTATSTTLTVPVPATAQTGVLSVSTLAGKVTSATEFFVAPPGVVAADILYTGRAVVNGATVTAAIPTANKNGLMVFDGLAGQRINLGFSSVTISQFNVMVYRPDGVALTLLPSGVSTAGGGLELPVLPMSGTYTIVLDPLSTYTGNATVTVSTEVAGTITPGGSAVPVSIARVGQNARYTFSGTAGQTVSLGMTAVTVTGSDVKILKPDGSILVTKPMNTANDAIDTQVLPTSGTYAVLVDPQSIFTGNMTITLYNQADVTGMIAIDGSTVAPTLTVPGQRARYTFSGTAGQVLNLGVSGVSITNSNISILKPDGTNLALVTIGTGGGSVDPAALPVTGTYTVVVDPWTVYTGSATLTLSSAFTGSITLGGASVPVSLTRVGQTARYTFSGTAGQQVNIGVSSVTVTNATVSLLQPNNTALTSGSIGTTGGSVDPPVLPTTGTYTILVDPSGTATGSVTLTLSTEVTGSLTVNAAATPVTIARVGQNGRSTFAGTSGQLVTVRITGNTFPGLTTLRLLRQNGTFLTYTWSAAASFNLTQVTLPATETYTVVIDPSTIATGTLNLQVTNP